MLAKKNLSLLLPGAVCLAMWGGMTYADIDGRTQFLVLGPVALVALAYHQTQLKPLPEQMPRLAWFPKYRCRCQLAESIRNSADPLREIALRFESLGFECDRQTPLALHFTRGHARGDFDVRLAKLNVAVTMPAAGEVELSVKAEWLVLFDTGDLWRQTDELKRALELESPQREHLAAAA
ncbi:hypothetical protein LOC68_07125 [Blastopirellula sp. JC732]|uniref:Uncharacterized protein n=1 Tax=Blastopirellula sediminis TaxID=2894196 RepID=A0A9X1MLM2_9BACT|nr:hypothetical protein [Blastopirellula sediminis]MCC9609061.1 hypothetical protein [Blastopirellula sediminis]MCC9628162.1 hypothetical protein [Blastopirellula sediminis]